MQEGTPACAGSRVQEGSWIFRNRPWLPADPQDQPVEGSRRLNPHLGIRTLPSLLPQARSFFQILSMFCAGQSSCSSKCESPTSCQAETLAGISLLVSRRTVGTIDSIRRNPDPTAPANPALVRVSSDELISFRRPLGLSTAVDTQQRQFQQSPPFLLPARRKACTATQRTRLECDPAIGVSAGPCPSLLCQDGEPEQPDPAWLLHVDSSDGCQGSTGEWGDTSSAEGTGA